MIFLKLLDKTEFKGDFINIVKQAPKAFSSDIGKELLKTFGLKDDSTAYEAKYLKYKRKYLNLKQFI